MSRDKIINDLSDSHVTRLQKSLQELENLVITEAAKINPKRGTLKARTTVALEIRPKLKLTVLRRLKRFMVGCRKICCAL